MNRSNDIKKVSVIIPVYNEEEAIVSVIADINENFADIYEYEIIVIDDASTDSTVEKVKGLPFVNLIQRTQNGGSGTCRKQGILAAKYDIIAMLDGDATYRASDIVALLQNLNDFDMVSGVRDVEFGQLKFLRTAVKYTIRKVAEILTLRKIGDLNTGSKVLRKEKLMPYIDMLPKGFSCVTTMSLIFILSGARVGYVPIDYLVRKGSSKFHPLFDTWRYLLTVFRVVGILKPFNIIRVVLCFLLLFFVVFNFIG